MGFEFSFARPHSFAVLARTPHNRPWRTSGILQTTMAVTDKDKTDKYFEYAREAGDFAHMGFAVWLLRSMQYELYHSGVKDSIMLVYINGINIFGNDCVAASGVSNYPPVHVLKAWGIFFKIAQHLEGFASNLCWCTFEP